MSVSSITSTDDHHDLMSISSPSFSPRSSTSSLTSTLTSLSLEDHDERPKIVPIFAPSSIQLHDDDDVAIDDASAWSSYCSKRESIFASLCQQLIDTHSLTPDDESQRHSFITQLTPHIHHIFGQSSIVHITGSFATGLSLRGSDIDLAIEIKEMDTYATSSTRHHALSLMTSLSTYLTDIEKSWEITSMLTPNIRIPLIKIYDPMTGISCDLKMLHRHDLYKTELIQQYLSCDIRLRPLILCIKQWACMNRINCAQRHTFNSFGLTMMVIQACQMMTPPVLPVLDVRHIIEMVDTRRGVKTIHETMWEEDADEDEIFSPSNPYVRRRTTPMKIQLTKQQLDQYTRDVKKHYQQQQTSIREYKQYQLQYSTIIQSLISLQHTLLQMNPYHHMIQIISYMQQQLHLLSQIPEILRSQHLITLITSQLNLCHTQPMILPQFVCSQHSSILMLLQQQQQHITQHYITCIAHIQSQPEPPMPTPPHHELIFSTPSTWHTTNTSSLHTLLLFFFGFYSHRFNRKSQAINIARGSLQLRVDCTTDEGANKNTKQENKEQALAKRRGLMVPDIILIQDPFNPMDNIARALTLKKWMNFVSALRCSFNMFYSYFSDIMHSMSFYSSKPERRRQNRKAKALESGEPLMLNAQRKKKKQAKKQAQLEASIADTPITDGSPELSPIEASSPELTPMSTPSSTPSSCDTSPCSIDLSA